MDNFPLSKAAGLSRQLGHISQHGELNGDFKHWIPAEQVERLLANAPVVYLCSPSEAGLHTIHFAEPVDATHTARLINKQRIVRDTAEGLLRELVDINTGTQLTETYTKRCFEISERARRLLEEK